jgi:hypothetical protein
MGMKFRCSKVLAFYPDHPGEGFGRKEARQDTHSRQVFNYEEQIGRGYDWLGGYGEQERKQRKQPLSQ